MSDHQASKLFCLGVDLVGDVQAGRRHEIKLVFNSRGAFFFPMSQQHRDQKAPGVSYEDDSRGNALAAIVRQRQIEVRQHRAFSHELVKTLIEQLSRYEGLAYLRECTITYGGRR